MIISLCTETLSTVVLSRKKICCSMICLRNFICLKQCLLKTILLSAVMSEHNCFSLNYFESAMCIALNKMPKCLDFSDFINMSDLDCCESGELIVCQLCREEPGRSVHDWRKLLAGTESIETLQLLQFIRYSLLILILHYCNSCLIGHHCLYLRTFNKAVAAAKDKLYSSVFYCLLKCNRERTTHNCS